MKVKPAVVIITGIAGVLVCLSVARIVALQRRIPALVPRPAKIERHRGVFLLKPKTCIVADAESIATAEYLAERLRISTGYHLPVHTQTDLAETNGNIVLTTRETGKNLGGEG